MVDVVSGSHHHLKGRDQFTAGCAVPRHPKEPAEGGEGDKQTCSLAAQIHFRDEENKYSSEGGSTTLQMVT